MDYTAYTTDQLGQTLRAQRRSRSLSQQDVANDVGLLPKTVSRLEHAPETATVESLYKLISALQLELVLRSKTPSDSDTEW